MLKNYLFFINIFCYNYTVGKDLFIDGVSKPETKSVWDDVKYLQHDGWGASNMLNKAHNLTLNCFEPPTARFPKSGGF